MRRNNASIGRPAGAQEQSATPHGCSLLPGRLTVIFGALALVGCASAPPAPVRVDMPVIVPCVGEVPPRPAYEFDRLPATATDGEIVLALARDWTRGRKYDAELEAVIAGCH